MIEDIIFNEKHYLKILRERDKITENRTKYIDEHELSK